jgi:hypothetical protein
MTGDLSSNAIKSIVLLTPVIEAEMALISLFHQQGIIKVLPDLPVLLNINKDCLFLTLIINYELYAFHHFGSFK